MRSRVALIVLGTIAGLALLVGVVVGGYQLNWWLRGQEVNRSAQINNDSYNRQTGLVDAILRDIREAEQPGLPSGQRKAIVAQVCSNADQLTPEFRNQIGNHADRFIYEECPQ